MTFNLWFWRISQLLWASLWTHAIWNGDDALTLYAAGIASGAMARTYER